MSEFLIECARAEGLELSSVVDIAPAMLAYAAHFAKYEAWLQAGHAGDMGYLPRGRERRGNPLLVFPDAKSVLCVAVPYSARPLDCGGKGPRLARYMRGGDYHSLIPARIEKALEAARAKYPSLQWKICVDTSAVLERAWCSLAGLGWIGKNSMLIHPSYGSYLLLGVAFLNQEMGVGPNPLRNLCGNCSRCLKGCPTGALIGESELDARRCISYWTLERKRELSLSAAQARALGTWAAGCDICQEVCPFNTKVNAKVAKGAADLPQDPLEKTWEELSTETPEEFRARVEPTALNRVKPDQWLRNLELARANRNDSTPPFGLKTDK